MSRGAVEAVSSRRRVMALWAAALGFCANLGCGDSVSANSGLSEPLRVTYSTQSVTYPAQFVPGEIPVGNGPALASFSGQTVLRVAQANTILSANAQSTTLGVAVRIAGQGTGYWLSRMGSLDVTLANISNAAMSVSLSPNLGPGDYTFQAAAVGPGDNYGPLSTYKFFVRSEAPTGVVTVNLSWGLPLDLDLQLSAPDGTLISPKRANTSPNGFGADGGGYAARAGGDSLANCIDDGRRQETIAFAGPPIPGTYKVYVNLFDPCGQVGSPYKVEIVGADGAAIQTVEGDINRAESRTGGYGLGDLVTTVTF